MKFLLSLLTVTILLYGCTSTSNTDQSHHDKKDDSWALTNFIKQDADNPILIPSPDAVFTCPISSDIVQWEERNVLNPAAVVKDGQVHLFYRAQDKTGTSRIGLAVSEDGVNFKKREQPVFYPEDDDMKIYEWNYRKFNNEPYDPECATCYFDGVEDPRIVENSEGVYFMTYTTYDGNIARLAIASSEDLINWKKHGLVLKDEKYKDLWAKAGAIVTEQVDSKSIATKIDGKYWMYFGDTDLFMAFSDDLINWTAVENEENGQLFSVLHPRPGFFDSRLVEPGPYAMLREEGILLIYNGSNAANFNDPSLPKFTYAAGQALFEKEKPYKLKDRMQTHFIHPDKDYERVGEVNEVCFVEGLVYFKNKWFLYYGTADSKIAVAVRG